MTNYLDESKHWRKEQERKRKERLARRETWGVLEWTLIAVALLCASACLWINLASQSP